MKKLILGTAILLIGLVSCKKERELNNSSNKSVNPSMTSLNAPTNNGVQLEFNNFQHFEDWIDYLDNELDQPTNTDDDSLLYVYELNDYNNFHSLRRDVLVRNGLDDINAEFSLEEFDLLKPCDLIGDDVLKSLLNTDHEVIVGDTLYVYFPGNNIIGTYKNNMAGINRLREIDKCSSNLYMYSEFILDENFTYSLSTSRGNSNRSSLVVACGPIHTSTSGVDYGVYTYTPNRNSCVDYEYIFRVDVQRSSTGASSQIPIPDDDFISGSIDFGDGNTAPYGHKQKFRHTYVSTGTYSIQYTTVFKDIDNNIQTKYCSFELVVENNGCFIPSDFNYPTNKRTNPSNGWFIEYTASAQLININSPLYYRLQSWTKGYKNVRSDKYKRRRTRLETQITGDEKTAFCFPTRNIDVANISFFWRRKLSKRDKGDYGFFQENNFRSVHKLTNHGNIVTEVFTVKCN